MSEEKFFIHVPLIDMESEDDIRRVASAFLVLQNAAEVGLQSLAKESAAKLDIHTATLTMELAEKMAAAGAELQSLFAALAYRVSGYNLQEFVEAQRGFEPEMGRSAARMGDQLRATFPEVEPK